MSTATLQEKLNQLGTDADLMHQIVHGDTGTEVPTDGGNVPSVRKLFADISAREANGVAAAQTSAATAMTAAGAAATAAQAAVDRVDQLETTLELPSAAPEESGRGLVVAPEGGWTLGGTAASKNVGAGPGDVPTNADIVIPDLTNIDNAISYLVLNQLADHDRTYLLMDDGFADEFEDQSGVDTGATTATYTTGQYAAPAGASAGYTQSVATAAGGAPGDAAQHWQQFQLQRAGAVSKVRLGTFSGSTAVDVEIRAANNTTVLWSRENVTMSGTVELTLETPLNLQINTTYHLVIKRRTTLLNVWAYNNNNPYSYGISSEGSGIDFVFGIYQDAISSIGDVVSVAYVSESAPEEVKLFARAQYASTADVAFYASRDNGETWSEITMDVSPLSGATIKVLTGKISVAAQPAGTHVRMKAVLANAAILHGWRMLEGL